MVFTDISTIAARVFVKVGGREIELENLDPDSDIVGLNDRQTGDGEVTPDGYFNAWSMRTPIEVNITCTGASKGGRKLQGVLNAQATGRLENVSLTVTNQERSTTYGPGVLLSAKPAPHLGNQKIQPVTFNFKFGNLV